MKFYRFKDLNITSSRKPSSTHLFIETSDGDLYLVDSVDNTKIYKSTDKGDNWSEIEDRTYTIQGIWYDRTNERLYCHSTTNSNANHQMFYITLSNDVITEMGTLVTVAWQFQVARDIFPIGSDWYITAVNEVGPDHMVQVYKWTDPNWVLDAQAEPRVDNPHAYRSYFVTVVGTDAYFLTKETNLGDQVHLMKFDSTVPSLTTLFSSDDYRGARTSQYALVYDDSNIIQFVLQKQGDSLYYLMAWNISDSSITEGGVFDVSLMLDRNNSGTVPNEFEKVFGISNEITYEIKARRGGIVQLQDLSAQLSGNIVAITDSFLLAVNDGTWDVYEFTDVSSEIDEIEYDYGIIGIPQSGKFIVHPDFQANWNKGDSIKIYDQFDALEFWGIIKDKNRDDRGFYVFDIDSFGNEVYRVQYDKDYSADDLDTKQKDIIDNKCDFCYRSSSIVGTTTTFDYKYKRAIAYLFYLGRFLERQIPYIEPDGKVWTKAYDGLAKNAMIYPGTWNFKDDTVGSAPSGWTDFSGASCTATIISSLGGHRKVLELSDNNAAANAFIEINLIQGLDSTWEFYFAKKSIAANTDLRVYIREGGTILLTFRFQDNDMDYYDGAWKSIKDGFIVANTFYHIKVVLNDSANTYDVYIEGILEGNDLAYWNNSTSGSNGISLFTDSTHTGYIGYYDAIGLSTDPTYTVGDNSVGWELSNHWQNAHFIDIPDIRDIQPGYFEGNTGITRATVRYKDNTLSTKPTIPGSGKTEEEQLKGILPLEEFDDPKIEASTEADQLATNLHAIFSLDTVYLTLFVEGQGFFLPGRTLEIQSSDQIIVTKNDYVILQYTRDPKNDRYYNIILSDNIVLTSEFKTLNDTSPKQLRTALVQSFENQADVTINVTNIAINVTNIATNVTDIDALNSTINQILMSGKDGFVKTTGYGAVYIVLFSDVNAGILSTFYVGYGGSFKLSIIHSGTDNNFGKTAGGVLYINYDVDGGLETWDIGAQDFNLPLEDTRYLKIEQFGTAFTVANNSKVGVLWKKDNNAGGALGTFIIYGMFLTRQ